MNRYKLSKAGINANEGIARFSGRAELYEKFLYQFPQDENFSLLCAAIRQQDVKAAFIAAHSLKGIAGNLSLTKLYEDLCPLVEQLRAGSLSGAEALLQSVRCDYEALLSVLTETV